MLSGFTLYSELIKLKGLQKMKKSILRISFSVLTVSVFLLITGCSVHEKPVLSTSTSLNDEWKMQASDKLSDTPGEQISIGDFDDSDWSMASVPGTVLGSLAIFNVIEDPGFGINMQNIDPSQFRQPWWFRTNFNLSDEDLGKNVSLRFNGINYRADLWVNGKKIADREEFAGTFRMFTFSIDDCKKTGENTIALKVWPFADGEYSIGFVDWNPLPLDRNMGIFREVFLETNEGIKIRSPFVYSKVKQENSADLFIKAELINSSPKEVSGILRMDYELGIVEKEVVLKPGETISCHFDPSEFSQLSVTDPELWWPNGMGNPRLYNLKAEFISGRNIIDMVKKKYGIREIRSRLNADGNRVFEVNGKFVLIKGGGWTDDVFLRDTRKSVKAQLKYVRHMNLNCIRCEGFWGKDETLYDLCDEYGIFIMVGWSCQWEWEDYLLKPCDEKYGGAVTTEDINLIAAYWKDQMLWLRNHPSIFIWMLGSDKLPAPALEKKYVNLFEAYDPSRPYATSAKGASKPNKYINPEVALVSDISGPTGMKMLGPYAFTPPVYWHTDTILGGAWGFNTETCPGESVPPASSLKRMLPEESLWPIDKKYWEYHTGRNQFTTLDRFREALLERYGDSKTLDEFAFKSQVSNFEVMRPMFEAFIANKPSSTGIIQWKLNSAWPDLIWQLYDTYLQPNGSFYAARKACNPVHALYRYGFDDIFLTNEGLTDADSLTVTMRIFDLNSKQVFSAMWTGTAESNKSKMIYKLPALSDLTSVWFLDLRVKDRNGREIDNNVYWLSRKKDIPDYEAAARLPWAFYTPTKQYADFTELEKLPVTELKYDYNFEKVDEAGVVKLKVKNPSETIAFFLFFDLVEKDTGNPVLPVFWDDNYITLFPGEERILEAGYSLADTGGSKPELEVSGWNVEKVVLK
jgi:exo-1,4-beta-D-glucosaminidase